MKYKCLNTREWIEDTRVLGREREIFKYNGLSIRKRKRRRRNRRRQEEGK